MVRCRQNGAHDSPIHARKSAALCRSKQSVEGNLDEEREIYEAKTPIGGFANLRGKVKPVSLPTSKSTTANSHEICIALNFSFASHRDNAIFKYPALPLLMRPRKVLTTLGSNRLHYTPNLKANVITSSKKNHCQRACPSIDTQSTLH